MLAETPVPLAVNPSADVDGRKASGERRIELPETALHATRVSEKFQIPEEAIRTAPPPPPATEDRAPGHEETRRMPVPDSIKRLAVPTPPPFAPSSVAIPQTTPLLTIAAPADAEPVEAPVAAKETRRTRARREVASALVLFVILLVATVIAIPLIAILLFA